MESIEAFLLSVGYTKEEFEEEWEDCGGPEDGPMIHHYPAYICYTSEEDYVYFYPDKGEYHREERDLELEAYLSQWESEAART